MTLATQGIGFGAFTPIAPGGDSLEAINFLEAKLNRRLDVVNSFRKWGGDSGNFERAKASLIQQASKGRSPMITWEPLHWDATPGPYALASTTSGDNDAYLTEWAVGLRSLGFTVYMRPMHEMNGNWYPWSGDPEHYVRTWRHMVDIFDREGVDNVKWVWCVNTTDAPYGNRMESYWPGESYVDIIGIDGYNCYGGWRTFDQINRGAYNRVCALDPDKPIWIVETASAEPSDLIKGAAGHTKAEWIRDMFATPNMERITMLIWFDEANAKSYDWRVSSSSSAQLELRRQLSKAVGYIPPPTPYLPPVPTGVTVVPSGPGAVTVSWAIASGFVRGYRVMVRNDKSWTPVLTYPKPPPIPGVFKQPTRLTAQITGLAPGETGFAMSSYTLARSSAASPMVTCVVE